MWAVAAAGRRIAGDLITIEPALYRKSSPSATPRRDTTPTRPATSHYIRTTRSIIATNPLPGGDTWDTFHTKWIYLAGSGTTPTAMPRVTDDDRLAHLTAR